MGSYFQHIAINFPADLSRVISILVFGRQGEMPRSMSTAHRPGCLTSRMRRGYASKRRACLREGATKAQLFAVSSNTTEHNIATERESALWAQAIKPHSIHLCNPFAGFAWRRAVLESFPQNAPRKVLKRDGRRKDADGPWTEVGACLNSPDIARRGLMQTAAMRWTAFCMQNCIQET